MNVNKKVLISIISAVVVIAIAVGVVIWKWPTIEKKVFKNDKTESKKETTSQSAQTDKKDGGEVDYNFETVDTGNKSVNVTDVKAAASSTQIEVPIYATKNPGMVAAMITVTYDTEAFTFADCEGGEVFDNCEGSFNTSTNSLKIIAQNGGVENLKLVSGPGVMCKIILKPTDKAKAGTYKTSVKIEAAGLNDKLVDAKAEAGNIILS